jgi:putative ABC transport system ATP-binding protein
VGNLGIRDLVVEYSRAPSGRPIDGLDLDVSAGSLAILLGPSRCGKTTCCPASAGS